MLCEVPNYVKQRGYLQISYGFRMKVLNIISSSKMLSTSLIKRDLRFYAPNCGCDANLSSFGLSAESKLCEAIRDEVSMKQ